VTVFDQVIMETGAPAGRLAALTPFTLATSCTDDAGNVTGEVTATTSEDGSFIARGSTGTALDTADDPVTVFDLDADGGIETVALVAGGTQLTVSIWGRVVAGTPSQCVFGGFAAGTTP